MRRLYALAGLDPMPDEVDLQRLIVAAIRGLTVEYTRTGDAEAMHRAVSVLTTMVNRHVGLTDQE
jgi:hypothetical protein